MQFFAMFAVIIWLMARFWFLWVPLLVIISLFQIVVGLGSLIGSLIVHPPLIVWTDPTVKSWLAVIVAGAAVVAIVALGHVLTTKPQDENKHS